MMPDKRLMHLVEGSMAHVIKNILSQWGSLISNAFIMYFITNLLVGLYLGSYKFSVTFSIVAILIFIVLRFVFTKLQAKESYLSSKTVKRVLREKIYQKLLALGADYDEKVQTSEIVQVTVEGVDQLETYFGQYIPQFFYSVIAPFTLFIILLFVNVPTAVVLLVCVPMIPISIAVVQTWAKKLLSKYWGQYTQLGDTFLENLQGLTTLKIYQTDDLKEVEMAEESERFRKITMKVLTMQLNSITIMDIVAYGGAALGMIMGMSQFAKGNVDLAGMLFIILISADFFIPMRVLGSFFHVGMNGVAAFEKIWNLLELPVEEKASEEKALNNKSLEMKNVHFSYEENREVLHGIDMIAKEGALTALVGESGCGKSTMAAIFMGRNKGFSGQVLVGGIPIEAIPEAELMKKITYVGHDSYLFKGTVRDNLLMGKKDASDDELWEALEKTRLAEFVKEEGGLGATLQERASNWSGGQRQRLAFARALLHDSDIYIFDEATSNIDVDSENEIIKEVENLSKTKTVLLISHRLANVVKANMIYSLDAGNITESGNHDDLIAKNGAYAKLYNAQKALEEFKKA